VVFQHGSARAPRFAEGHTLLPHEQLQDLMAHATVLVTHGGPATICEAWRHGRMPLVVPRDPQRGEHVDGHQQRFSRRLGGQGLVLLCEERAQLERALDEARQDPARVLFGADEGPRRPGGGLGRPLHRGGRRAARRASGARPPPTAATAAPLRPAGTDRGRQPGTDLRPALR